MAQRSVPAPFLTKTYHLVDDPASDDVISWNQAGTAFVVWKTAEFAKDLLPNYFKHNNFSSFVRQLNTYGFRKTVPDKWEFANENFQRGQKELLAQIRRRKTATMLNLANCKAGVTDNLASPATSGEDLGSSSTSSPESKNPSSLETLVSAQVADLSGENEKLRKDNQMLSSELTQTKKQCDELIAILTQCVTVAPDQISRIMNLGEEAAGDGNIDCDDDDDDDETENCMKLFGVLVKKKRGCGESTDLCGPHKKQMKRNAPWMEIAASPGESNKVCN